MIFFEHGFEKFEEIEGIFWNADVTDWLKPNADGNGF